MGMVTMKFLPFSLFFCYGLPVFFFHATSWLGLLAYYNAEGKDRRQQHWAQPKLLLWFRQGKAGVYTSQSRQDLRCLQPRQKCQLLISNSYKSFGQPVSSGTCFVWDRDVIPSYPKLVREVVTA
nr:RING/FYVE/PHD zinc finger superfamily protein isoform 4 [Ipomoea batatas]